MKSIAVAVALSALIAPVASVATPPPPVADISVEEVGRGGPSCGVTQQTTKSAVRAAMRYNRIMEEEPESRNRRIPTFHVSGNVENVNGQCVGNVDVELYVFTATPLPWDVDKRILGKTVFCQQGGFAGGPPGKFAAAYFDIMKQAFDLCLSDMTEAALPQ